MIGRSVSMRTQEHGDAMPDTDHKQDSRARHAIAFAAGILSMVAFYALPGGIGTYLMLIVIGIVAVLIGHGAVLRAGPIRWLALIGLVLAYMELIVSAGLLVIRLTRMLAG